MAVSTVKSGPNGLDNDLYAPGTYTENLPCFGYITNSAHDLTIYARPYKLLNRVSSVSVSAMKITARILGGGYVGGASNYDAFSNASSISSWASGKDIVIVLTKKSNGTWGNNNAYFVGSIPDFTYTLG